MDHIKTFPSSRLPFLPISHEYFLEFFLHQFLWPILETTKRKIIIIIKIAEIRHLILYQVPFWEQRQLFHGRLQVLLNIDSEVSFWLYILLHFVGFVLEKVINFNAFDNKERVKQNALDNTLKFSTNLK